MLVKYYLNDNIKILYIRRFCLRFRKRLGQPYLTNMWDIQGSIFKVYGWI